MAIVSLGDLKRLLGSEIETSSLDVPRETNYRLIASRNFGHETGRTDIADRCFVFSTALSQYADGPLQFIWDNYHVFTAAGETSTLPITISAAISVYNGSWNYIGRLKFQGQDTAFLSSKAFAISDPVNLGLVRESQSQGLLRINIVTRVQTTLGQAVPTGTNASGGVGIEGDTTLLTLAGGGTAVASGAVAGQYNTGVTYGPSAIRCITSKRKSCGVLLLGNSIQAGTGETSGSGSPHGWAVRRLTNLGIGYMYAPRSGQSISDWMSVYSFREMRLGSSAFCPVTIFEYIINDIQAGRTFAQIKANCLAAWAELAQSGTKVYQTTAVPVATISTDSWATASGQTPSLSAANEQTRKDFNRWLRSNEAYQDANGALTGVIDIAAAVEVDANNNLSLYGGRWLTNGTANFYTADGLHPSTNGHILIGDRAIDSYLGAEWFEGY